MLHTGNRESDELIAISLLEHLSIRKTSDLHQQLYLKKKNGFSTLMKHQKKPLIAIVKTTVTC